MKLAVVGTGKIAHQVMSTLLEKHYATFGSSCPIIGCLHTIQ